MDKHGRPHPKIADPSASERLNQTDKPYENPQANLHAAVQRARVAPQHLLPAQVLALQRTIGNQAVARLLAPGRALQRSAAAGMAAPPAGPVGAAGGDLTTDAAQSIQTARGGGAPMDDTVRGMMESRFGADFSRVRVHTDRRADRLNRAMNARAFTTGHDIFFSRGEYKPDLKSGQRLLAHELTHVVQQSGAGSHVQRDSDVAGVAGDSSRQGVKVRHQMSSSRISTKKRMMHLDFVRMKRQDRDLGRIIKKKLGMHVDAPENDEYGVYGHWWTEIGSLRGDNFIGQESYGWWPAGEAPSGLRKAFGGVPGLLNQEGPNSRRDPHHGDDATVEFHPVMNVDPDAESYDQIKNRVTDDIRNFAAGYSGKWNWKLGWGKNCHTFQQAMKTRVGLHYQKTKEWLIDPQVVAVRQQAEANAQKREQAKKNVVKVFTIPDDRGLDVNDAEGNSLPGTIRGGEQVGATGVVKQVTQHGHTFEYGEYVRMEGGAIYYSELMNWENQLGEAYPRKTDTAAPGAPENLSKSPTSSNSIVDLAAFGM